jgi:hypothetical protein
MIHVIGDSHVSVFTGLHGVCPAFPDSTPHALDSFRVWHLGPFLAYSVDKPTHRVCRLALQCLKHVPMKSQIAFFMGEIDCRNHILKHGSSRRTIVQNAKKVATRYVRAVDELSRPRKPVKLAVVALPPTHRTPRTRYTPRAAPRGRGWPCSSCNGGIARDAANRATTSRC